MQKNKLPQTPKHTPRKLIVSLYCQNYSLSEIADHCNEHNKRSGKDTRAITARDVYTVLHKSRIRWQERESTDRAELRADELHRIDNLEREYWEAWFRSVNLNQTHSTNMEKYSAITDGPDYDTYDPGVDVDELREQWGRIPSRAERRNNGKPSRRNYAAKSLDGMTQTEVKMTRKLVETCGDPRFLKGIERCIEMRRQMLGLDAPTRSITGQMTPEMIRQMAREMAPEYDMQPDDPGVDDIVASVEKMLSESRGR